jgi:surfeit locus 1 family protein
MDPTTRAQAQPEARVEVTGIVTPGGRASSWTPDNDPARNSWFYVDPAAIAAARGLGPVPAKVPDLVVEADATPNPRGLPVGGQTATELPNRHLEYVLTWYSLALALVVIYVLYVRRHARPG